MGTKLTGADRKKTTLSEQAPSAEALELRAILEDAGLASEVGFLMRLAQSMLLDFATPRLQSLNLTPGQMTVLRVIRSRPGMTQQRIADALRMQRANLTSLINELEAQGLVIRKMSPERRRAHALYLTPKGERTVQRMLKIVFDDRSACIERLEPEEKALLTRLLQKVVFECGPAG